MSHDKYSRLAREHLREHRPTFFKELEASEKLESYLEELGHEAESLEMTIYGQYLERNPAPIDFFERVAHIAHAQRIAEETVLSQMILVPDEETERAILRGGY
jgi:Transposon-encoded protein TnpV